MRLTTADPLAMSLWPAAWLHWSTSDADGGERGRPMSDDYLRQLEARWRETGDAPDEARLLLERMRAGLLGRPRLELAAFLGHEAARLALPASPTLGGPEPTRLADDLWPWGKEAAVAGAVAAAHAVVAEPARDPRPRRAVEAAAAWVHCPCEAHVAQARRAGDAALEAAGIAHASAPPAPGRFAALAAHHAAIGAAAWPVPVALKHAFRAVKYAEEAALAGGLLRRDELTAIMCQALTLWALGPEHAGAEEPSG